MYGTVNQAIVDYITNKFGADGAAAVRSAAGSPAEFLAMEQYPDSDSVGLVVATAERAGVEAGQILEEVGEYWIDFALRSEFADHLRMSGSTLPEILHGLDDMHVRLSQAFVGYKPPSFWVSDAEGDEMTLHYVSERDGLGPLAKGMVRGLAKMTETEVEITDLPDDGSGETRFRIRMLPSGSQS